MLTLWNAFDELLRDDALWSSPRARFAAAQEGIQPAVDVVEQDDAYVLHAELPGMKPGDVDLQVSGNVLTLRGERRSSHEDTQNHYRRIERQYGRFERSFSLPETVDPQQVEAHMENGLLQVRLAKRSTTRPRAIEVKAGSLADRARKLFTSGKREGQPHA